MARSKANDPLIKAVTDTVASLDDSVTGQVVGIIHGGDIHEYVAFVGFSRFFIEGVGTESLLVVAAIGAVVEHGDAGSVSIGPVQDCVVGTGTVATADDASLHPDLGRALVGIANAGAIGIGAGFGGSVPGRSYCDRDDAGSYKWFKVTFHERVL